MFDFLSRSTLGVDIGTASIKIVEIAKSLPKPKLKNYGILRSRTYLERPNSAIQTNSLKILEKETADLLRILVKKAKFFGFYDSFGNADNVRSRCFKDHAVSDSPAHSFAGFGSRH